jgi:glycosyltransferase involved in cell wall biosynthesis
MTSSSPVATSLPERCRVAVVTTHPIQYQVPWLRLLSSRSDIDLHVFFAMLPDATEQGREFGVSFEWDLPLLEGYRYSVLDNVAERPSLTEFSGCDTPKIVDAIRDGKFDAVIVNGWVAKTCLQALWGCLRSGTPCIVRGEVNGLPPRAAWKRLGHRLLLSRYAAMLAIGTHNRAYYLARGVARERLFHTPYCVDNRRFAAAADACREAQDRVERCTRFGLDPSATTFLFSGKFVGKKRPGDLIAALRIARSRGAPVQVLLVGDGPLAGVLRGQATDLPVRFAGFLNQGEIGAAYAAADALVLPSNHGETWGLVVNEAMASGLPAIVSDQVGCAPDLILPGETGEVFQCGDLEALADLLVTLGGDRERLQAMGMRARRHVHERFHFEAVADGVAAALSAVTKRRSTAC